MKLKKLYTSFLCYMILVAFAGVVSLEISSSFSPRHPKTEVGAAKKEAATDLNFVLEEDNEPANGCISALIPAILSFQHFIALQRLADNEQATVSGNQTLQPKEPLFIHLRTLRL